MENPFFKHPRNVNESYLTHFLKTLRILLTILVLSCKIMAHAIFPFFYEFTVSDRIKELNEIDSPEKKKISL